MWTQKLSMRNKPITKNMKKVQASVEILGFWMTLIASIPYHLS